jgi:GT2 family glycosyltransferase
MAKPLAVVIPVFGQHHLTAALLEDVRTEDELVDVLIVDNGGDYEPSGEERLLVAGTNLGWSGGCNLGLAAASQHPYEAFVLLNNDTRLSHGFFAGLRTGLADTGAGLLAPAFNDFWPQHFTALGGSAAAYRPVRRHRAVVFVDGTCMAIPRATYEAVGPLDAERFGPFDWGSELDYSLRVARAGLAICVTELSYLEHFRHATAFAMRPDCEPVASADMDAGMASKWGKDWVRLLDTSSRLAPGDDTVAVIIPSIPQRWRMLAECLASVARQSVKPTEHLVGIDHHRIGAANMLNRLAASTQSAWLAVVCDDDLLDARHLEVLMAAGCDADIVYPYCRVVGRGDWSPNREFDPDALREANYIPATALIRRTLWERLGGWRPEPFNEDHDFWLRAVDAAATFKCVPEVTWTYRFHGGNHSVTGVSA